MEDDIKTNVMSTKDDIKMNNECIQPDNYLIGSYPQPLYYTLILSEDYFNKLKQQTDFFNQNNNENYSDQEFIHKLIEDNCKTNILT